MSPIFFAVNWLQVFAVAMTGQPCNCTHGDRDVYGLRQCPRPVTSLRIGSHTAIGSSCRCDYWFSNDCLTTGGATFRHPITLNLYQVGPGNTLVRSSRA